MFESNIYRSALSHPVDSPFRHFATGDVNLDAYRPIVKYAQISKQDYRLSRNTAIHLDGNYGENDGAVVADFFYVSRNFIPTRPGAIFVPAFFRS